MKKNFENINLEYKFVQNCALSRFTKHSAISQRGVFFIRDIMLLICSLETIMILKKIKKSHGQY
jgi:hypothetical protein